MEFIYGGIGGVIFGGLTKAVSHVMQLNVDYLKSAKNVTEPENRKTSGFSYIEGNLTSNQPFVFNGDGIKLDVIALQKEIKAAQQESFQFGKAQSSGSSERLISPTHANYFGSWTIGDVGIVPSLRRSFPLSHLHSQFDLRNGGTNVNVVTSGDGEQYGTTNIDTIGVRTDVYGIVDKTEFTIVGTYDADRNKFVMPDSSVSIVSQRSMSELIRDGQRGVSATNMMSNFFLIAGLGLCAYGGVQLPQNSKK